MAKDKMKKKKRSSRVEEYMDNLKKNRNSVKSKSEFTLDEYLNELEKNNSQRSKFSLEEIESEPYLKIGKLLDDFLEKYNIDYNTTSLNNFHNHYLTKSKEYMKVDTQEIMTNVEVRTTIKELIEINKDLMHLIKQIQIALNIYNEKFRISRGFEDYLEQGISNFNNPYLQFLKLFGSSIDRNENTIKHYQKLTEVNEYTDSIIHNILESQDWLVKNQKYILKTKSQIKTDTLNIKTKFEEKIHDLFEEMESIANSFYFYNKTTNRISKTNDSNAIRGYDTKIYLDTFTKILKQPLKYGLNKSDITIIKSSSERLEDFFNYKANVYQFYPDIIQKDFYEKIYKKKEFYMNRQIPIDISKTDDIQQDLCPSENTNFKLQTHQKFMKNYLSVNTPYNGLLIFHGTGSGKTCSSITIAESYKNLIALSSKKILVILAKSVKSNFIKEIHDITRGYNQCTSSDYLNYDFFTNDDKKQKNVLSLIDKFYELITFGSFRNSIVKKLTKSGVKYDVNKNLPDDLVNWIDLMFSDKVIVVDEVHNLKKYKDDHGQDLDAELLDIDEIIDDDEMDSTDDLDITNINDTETDIDTSYFKPYHALELILKYAQNVKLVLLSATPMYHTPIEIVSILNLLLLNDKYKRIDPKNVFNGLELTDKGSDIIRISSQGYISYLRTESPFTFAKRNYKESIPIHEYVNNKLKTVMKMYDLKRNILNNDYIDPIKIVLCPMSTLHQNFYTTSLRNQISLSKIIEYGNIAKENPENIPDNQLKLTGSSGLLDKENSISSKIGALISNILSNVSNGTIFSYSWYVGSGTSIIARALLENGVEMAMYSKSERKISSADQKYIKHILGGKRTYRQPDSSQVLGYDGKTREQWKKEGRILDFKPMRFAYIIGKIEEYERDNLINSFNKDINKDGSVLKIMVGSGVFKEGISLKNVRQVHLLEPWHNRSRIEQVIGRALRHCSHKKLPPKDRQVDIYQYAITYRNFDSLDITRKFLKEKIKQFQQPMIKTPKIITGEFAKSGIFSYDIIMYMRSQILHNLVLDVKHILQETAIDCSFNREININTLKKEEQYECFKSLSDEIDEETGLPKIEWMEENDYKIDEEQLDYSTFDEFFYEPYIVFVINVLKKIFEMDRTTYTLTFSEILNNPIFDDQIYFEKNNFILRSALYRLIPKHNIDLKTFPHIIGKRVGRNRIYGYIFGRETEDGGLFIFQPFEDQSNIKDGNKIIKRSDFERTPMYEKTEFESLSAIEMPFINVSATLRNKFEEITKSKKKKSKGSDNQETRTKKVLNANELIKERDISLSDSKEADKNAPLIGLILDITNLPKMSMNNLWGEKGIHLWLREKVMICKKGKRSSIGQLATSFSVTNFQCMFNDYIFKHNIDSKEISKMMKKTKNKRAIIFAQDMDLYPNIQAWFEDRSIKNNRSKTAPAIKKLDYANIIYIIFKYFEEKQVGKSIWIRRLYQI
jgi:superfamily II DNA or RNA helicase